MKKQVGIRTRNIGGFVVVVGIMVITTLIIIAQMSFLGKSITQITNVAFKVNNSIWTAKQNIQNINSYIIDASTTSNSTKISQLSTRAQQEMKSARDCIQFVVDIYTQTNMQEKLNQAKPMMEYINQVDKLQGEIFVILSRTTEDQAAIKKFSEEFKPAYESAMGNLETVREHTKIDTENLTSSSASVIRILVIIAIISIIINIAISIFISISTTRAIVRPIAACATRLKKLAIGDLTSPVELIKTGDELEILTTSTDEIVTTVGKIITDLNYGLKEMANGNFTCESKHLELYVGDFELLAISMHMIIDQLTDTLRGINHASEQVASGSEQVAIGSTALSQGATEQASAIDELTSTLTEISSQITNNAQNASKVRDVFKTTSSSVEQSNKQMEHMILAMNNISNASNQIGKIIKTIDDIAFQTNILALNAAVEAARAGATGKGFAVVADEVRNLAAKSAEAAKSTTSLIESSIKAVSNGTSIVDNTAKSLLAIVDGTRNTEELIEQIAIASDEQAGAVRQVSLGVEQISSVVQNNSATAQQSAAASDELSVQAHRMRTLVEKFKLKKNINV